MYLTSRNTTTAACELDIYRVIHNQTGIGTVAKPFAYRTYIQMLDGNSNKYKRNEFLEDVKRSSLLKNLQQRMNYSRLRRNISSWFLAHLPPFNPSIFSCADVRAAARSITKTALLTPHQHQEEVNMKRYYTSQVCQNLNNEVNSFSLKFVITSTCCISLPFSYLPSLPQKKKKKNAVEKNKRALENMTQQSGRRR